MPTRAYGWALLALLAVSLLVLVAGDGQCTDPLYTLTMYDSHGDGWNLAWWTWTSADGEVVDSGTLTDGSSGTAAICDDSTDQCPMLFVSGGGYASEISWSVADSVGKQVMAGGASTEVHMCGGPSAAPTTGQGNERSTSTTIYTR